MRTLSNHWPEYVIEAICVAVFMVCAVGFATLLKHPASPLSAWPGSPLVHRIPFGLAMGLTSIAIVYSPLGGRTGGHLNPAMTLTYLRLGKVVPIDAGAYVAAQCVGAVAGIMAATWLFRGLPADPSVNYAATVPGQSGSVVAFLAEAAMSFGMMLTVLSVSNTPRLARFTGLCAGALIAIYITFEAPLSGMSMNPARTLGPALFAHTGRSLWLYVTAPVLGMLAAADVFARTNGRERVRCAKLHHPLNVRCIFVCGFLETSV